MYPKYPQILTRVFTSIYKVLQTSHRKISTRVHRPIDVQRHMKHLAGARISLTSTRTFADRFFTYKSVNLRLAPYTVETILLEHRSFYDRYTFPTVTIFSTLVISLFPLLNSSFSLRLFLSHLLSSP